MPWWRLSKGNEVWKLGLQTYIRKKYREPQFPLHDVLDENSKYETGRPASPKLMGQNFPQEYS